MGCLRVTENICTSGQALSDGPQKRNIKPINNKLTEISCHYLVHLLIWKYFCRTVTDSFGGGSGGVYLFLLKYIFFSLLFFLDLSNVMNSTPNIKAVNGKAESSDSGAESEEEGLREEEEKELQINGKGKFSRPLCLPELLLAT